jgi:hypothetical protein
MTGMEPRVRAALAWVAVALGQAAFMVVHLFHYIGGLAAEAESAAHGGHDHDHDHLQEVLALAEPGMMWMVLAWSVLTLAPAVIVLLGAGRGAALTTLIVGALGVVGGVIDGILHAVSDGDVVSAAAGIVLVGVPGAIAILATLAWMTAVRIRAD